MSKKDVLNQRTNQVTIVLNDSGADCFKSSRHIVQQLRCNDLLCILYIACIKHDNDIDEETQHVKTPHYHLIIKLDRSYRLGTMINLICDTFHCNANQVQIDKCTSLCMQSRYLIHLDEIDKYHYDENDVITFDCHNSRSEFTDYLNRLVKLNDINDIIFLVNQFPRLDILIQKIGLENYKKYRTVIQDLRRENLRY